MVWQKNVTSAGKVESDPVLLVNANLINNAMTIYDEQIILIEAFNTVGDDTSPSHKSCAPDYP